MLQAAPSKQKCSLIMTNKARENIEQISDVASFFAIRPYLTLHIEKRKPKDASETVVAIYFDAADNEELAEVLGDKTAIIDCIVKNDGFVAINFRLVALRGSLHNNRRLTASIHFMTQANKRGVVSEKLLMDLYALPIAEERSQYVRKRIAGWEGYLKIQEHNANIQDIFSDYSAAFANEDFTRMTFTCPYVKAKDFKKLENLSVSILPSQNDIGSVIKVHKGTQQIEVELRPNAQRKARQGNLVQHKGELSFSNFAELSQIRRLRKGFSDLEKGYAVNPELERLLFEKRPVVQPRKKIQQIAFHNNLNPYQQEAVRGALASQDLFVIQGPPGTGKTTVISEICLQNVRAGLRTLIASQSNLAVDNALGRLLEDADTRILRFGRTESIEEEGKKFIEDNVGYYWLEQTAIAVQEGIANQPEQTDRLQNNVQKAQQELANLQQELSTINEAVDKKNQAEKDYPQLEIAIHSLKKQLKQAKEQHTQAEQKEQANMQQLAQLQHSFNELNKQVSDYGDKEQLQAQLHEKQTELAQLHGAAFYQQLVEDEQHWQQANAKGFKELAKENLRAEQLREASKFVARVTRGELFLRFITNYQMMGKELYEVVHNLQQEQQYFEQLREPNARLQRAIDKLQAKTAKEWQQRAQIQARQQEQYFTQEQLSAIFYDMNAHYKKHGETWQEQAYVHYLAELYKRQQFIWREGQRVKALLQQPNANLVAMLQRAIKQEQFMNSFNIQRLQKELAPAQQKIANLREQMVQQQITLPELPTLSAKELGFLVEKAQQGAQRLTAMLANHQQLIQRHADAQQAVAVAEKQQEPLQNAVIEADKIVRKINSEGLAQQKQLAELDQLMQTMPEQQKQHIEEAITACNIKLTQLQTKLTQQPIYDDLQKEWQGLLADASEQDVEEIRKLYVKHANVIGTTCVASARKEFMESYAEFDVVIIDEVSKATPPELLLPMLKGKKVILVGDHHQLPPLLGDDTLEETLQLMLQEDPQFEGQNELRQLLKESLFERLFKQLPSTHKQMLALQYRMHENIMQSIVPFYAQEQDGLQCGLTDSDSVRDHKLTGQFIQRNDHLLWLDTPTKSPYLEQQVKGGTSRYNEGELAIIKDVLGDINRATANAIAQGDLPQGTLKSVGVISFYGEQVKRINRLIQQELQLPHVQLRTGTVDKFQGMEMDVVLVSMVRNADKGGDVGFAKDYRRLNVALSRAREVLMLIGSTAMFTTKARHEDTRKMYSTLLQTVTKQGGLRTTNGQVKV